ncbi:hypothetical protein [uncultured Marixanthomonas sp.]|uniref:CBU_0592 family membrane protein n=1 Tax=uncultured Marixanthomonas sp. TaxID=757245 RepID=UPI0030D7EC0C
MQTLIDIMGWVGSFFILLSYGLTLSKKRDFSVPSRYLNMVGGMLIAINCLYYNAIPPFVTNLIWSIIAILSIYRARKHFINTGKQ